MGDRTSDDIVIEADAAKIMDVIADVVNYPKWSDGVLGAEVLKEADNGRPLLVRWNMGSGPLKDKFVLKYDFDGTESVDWVLIEGHAVTKQDGTYVLVGDGDGTKVTFAMETGLAVPMPGFMRRKLEKKIVNDALKGLKGRVESI